MFGKEKKEVEQKQVPTATPQAPKAKNLISLEEVQQVLSGDEKALQEQIEKAKQVMSAEDLESYKTKLKSGEIKLDESLTIEGLAKMEAERKAKEAEAARKLKEAKEAELKRLRDEANAKIQRENALKMQNKAKLEAEEKIKMAALAKKQAEKEKLKQQQLLQKKQEEEKKKKEKEEKSKRSNFKYIATTVLIIFMILFVIFLPQVRIIFNSIKESLENNNLTTGKLICSIDKFNDNLDANYTYTFEYKENELELLTYIKTIRGDATLDEVELNEIHSDCNNLKLSVVDYDGIEINCSLTEGLSTERQVFSYDSLDLTNIKSSYAEYGGTLPSYQYKQNIDSIEDEMIDAGYDCERTS